jgi:hypothetical protein
MGGLRRLVCRRRVEWRICDLLGRRARLGRDLPAECDRPGAAADGGTAADGGAAEAGDGEEEARVAAAERAFQIRALRGNFVYMSVCFSLNHACVTSALALSTANLGSVLGNASNATLYVLYTCSALAFAGPHVRRRGSKQALVDSTFAFCVYVGSFYVAEVWRDVAWVAAIGGADMPVVVSMLNSYSGWAAAATL